MIRHIFKLIWNERKSNTWIICEFILVFVVLWFCVDFLFFFGNRYIQDQGTDINHTYMIVMGEKPLTEGEQYTKEERYAFAMTFMDRVKRYPGVEAVCLCDGAAMPYSGSTRSNGYVIVPDSGTSVFQIRSVTPEYFDVFKIKLQSGKIFNWPDEAAENDVVVHPGTTGLVGNKDNLHDPLEVKKLTNAYEEYPKNVVGTTAKVKTDYYRPFDTGFFQPMPKRDIRLSSDGQAIRVSPEADHNFIEKFNKDMRDQLNIGPYYFIGVSSFDEAKYSITQLFGINGQINGIYSITVFLIINIFLGILGTFWFRTQSRRSEIGLRIALGASKSKVKSMLLTETILLLFIAAIVGTIVALNLGNLSLIESLGIPTKSMWNYGENSTTVTEHLTNFALTFGFLLLISVAAVWYPARQASDTQPAEALHDE